MVFARERAIVTARDNRLVSAVVVIVWRERDRANVDELAVLGATRVADVSVMHARRPLTDRVERDDQAREGALDFHSSMMRERARDAARSFRGDHRRREMRG